MQNGMRLEDGIIQSNKSISPKSGDFWAEIW
jgi:hypothetical protein